jgi:hypothetical protein
VRARDVGKAARWCFAREIRPPIFDENSENNRENVLSLERISSFVLILFVHQDVAVISSRL